MTPFIAFCIGFALGLPVSAAIVFLLMALARTGQIELATKNGDR